MHETLMLYRRKRLDRDIITALACAHCHELEIASECQACRCTGAAHVICYGCSTQQLPELIGPLLVTEVRLE